MSLLSLIVSIAFVGLILWLVNSYVPMQENVKRILNAVVVVVLVLWLIQSFGLMASCYGVRLGP